MVTRKEDTPQRIASRKYEERNKEKRRAASGNFQTMIPRDLYEEINAYLKKNKITKVDFIKMAYEIMKKQQRNTLSAYKTRNIGKKQGEIVKQGKSARLPFRYGRENQKETAKRRQQLKKL